MMSSLEGSCMNVDADRFRSALSNVPQPVAVLIVRDAQGRPVGFTATAVCSLSIDPPSLIVCVDRLTRCCDAMRICSEFTVDFLAAEHRELARLFSTRGADKFASPQIVADASGSLRVDRSLVHIRCSAGQRYEVFDHLVVVGTAESLDIRHGDPLLVADGEFAVPLQWGR